MNLQPQVIVGAKRPLRPMHVWAIRVRLQIANRLRDLALFDIALDSKLRGCDVVSLRLPDILAAGAVRSRAIVIQQKTGRPVQFEITEQTRRSLGEWLKVRRGEADSWLFPSRMNRSAHLSTGQYIRLLKEWVVLIGLEPAAFGTHSHYKDEFREGGIASTATEVTHYLVAGYNLCVEALAAEPPVVLIPPLN